MTEGFVRKKYNRMYVAMLLSWVVFLLGTLSDSIIGGIFISEDAVSATGLVQPVFSLVTFISSLLSIGCSNKFANYAGAFDKKNASKAAGMGLMLAIISGALIASAAFLFRNAFFRFFAVGPEIEQMAREYYNMFILLLLVQPVYQTLYYLALIDGDDTCALISDIICAVTNAGFSLLLVQHWGIRGLACGTLISTLFGFAVVIPHFFSKRNSVTFKFEWDAKIFGEIAASGSTMSLTTLYIAIIDIVMNKFVIDHFGDAYLAAYAVVNLILNLAQIATCAVDAASPFVCVSYGERNPKGLRSIMNICTKRVIVTCGCMTALLLVIAGYVPAIYGITTPEVMEISVYITRVLALSYLMTGFVYEWVGYFPKVNKPFLGNLTGFVYMLAAPLIFPTLFGKLWGFKGLVWGFFTTPFAAVLVVSIYIVVRYGKKAFPYVIDENDSAIFIHEYAVEPSEITMLRDTLREEMRSAGVESGIANKAEMILEETLMIVLDKNRDSKKKILGDCTLIVRGDRVNLITRDNGRLFDITEEAEHISDLRHYVAARLIDNSEEATYLTTISFNRNSYIWAR